MTFKPNWQEADIIKLHELRNSGLTFKEIAERIGKSKQACKHKARATRHEYATPRIEPSKITLAPVPQPRGMS